MFTKQIPAKITTDILLPDSRQCIRFNTKKSQWYTKRRPCQNCPFAVCLDLRFKRLRNSHRK